MHGDSKPDSAHSEPDDIEKAKSKLLLDFGLEQKAPERITIEVLKQLIRERPERMTQAVRKWLHPDK